MECSENPINIPTNSPINFSSDNPIKSSGNIEKNSDNPIKIVKISIYLLIMINTRESPDSLINISIESIPYFNTNNQCNLQNKHNALNIMYTYKCSKHHK